MKSYEIRVTRLNEVPNAPIVSTPDEAVWYWKTVITAMPWFIPDREVAVALSLNTQNRVTGHHLVSIGSLNETVVHVRDVFRAAVAMNAYSVVLMHNHPSGESAPSEADKRITQRLQAASEILQIRMLDHVIVGHAKQFSFREAGLI